MANTPFPPPAPGSLPPTPDLQRFRVFLRRGAPGPHAHVVLLGLETFDAADLLRTVRKGFVYRTFERFQRNTALPFEFLIALIDIPRRTLTRRKREGRFLPDESDRLLRASRIFGQALELFDGDRQAATDWLTASQPALGGAVPLDMARTEVGAREVERLILRLEHGVFSQWAMTAWRIVKARHAANAFDGEGARLAGGRWNAPGSAVVYTSGSAALAALELLVHLGRVASLPTYVLIACSFDDTLVTALDRSRLPPQWRSYPAPSELQLLGDQWLKSGASVMLEVPSAVVPTESNYLINPRHRDFASIVIAPPEPFAFDLRLLTS